jgi:RNA polymerase sigma factor (sigma-70 family)
MYQPPGGADGATKAPADAAAPGVDRKVGALARARRAVLSDDRLAKQAAAGDLGALEAIFSRYRDDLYRFCVGILREPQDAQDAVQNTMIKAMRALPGERRAMQLKPWLYRIAHNEAIELRRRERPVEELPVTVDDVGALTDERAEENGRLRTLLADIADLPERQRASLVLREVNGLSFGEIGATLGTSPGAVRQSLYEARRALAEMDSGRDMRCDAATRMVSDADGSPRDRGVRAHLRDCSPCRRFQAEIMDRSRTFAAISPMPAIVAAGALKAALGGSGAAAGGSGTAAVAGGAGTGAGATGLAGSIGATALLKPAASVLTLLALGSAAIDHGAIFDAGRHDPPTTDSGRSAPGPATRIDQRSRGVHHAIAWDGGKRDAGMPTDERATPAGNRLESASTAMPGREEAPATVAVDPGVSVVAAAPRAEADPRGEEEAAPPAATTSPALADAGHDEAVAPVTSVPPGQAKEEVEAAAEPVPTSEASAPETYGSETPARVPPGQAKKKSEPTPAPSEWPTAEAAPPEAAKVPPGQAKKQPEATSEPTTSEASAPASTLAEAPAEDPAVPVETTEAAKAPPGQAKREEAAP